MTTTTYPNLTAARAALPHAVLILSPRWGGMPADRKWWMAEKNGEVLDYDTAAALLLDYMRKGEEIYVLTMTKSGEAKAKYYPSGATT